MTEQQIQSNRIKELEAEGYYVLKLMKTNKNGIPDILALKPGADVLFSEVKRPKGKVSRLQDLIFVADESFMSQIKLFTISEAVDIWSKLEDAFYDLPVLDVFTQTTGMVIHNKKEEPTFLEVEFLKEDVDFGVLIDIVEVDSDNYLDKILSNEYIPYTEGK